MYVCMYIYIYTDLCLMKEHCGHRKIPVLQTMGPHVLHLPYPRALSTQWCLQEQG